jgi:hypothetical protein
MAGVAIVALAIVIPVVRKAQAAYDKSDSQVEQARNRLQDAKELRMLIEAERGGQKAIRQRLAQRPSNFSLYGFTNRYLRELNLETRADLQTSVSRMSGMEQVKLSLKGVSMEEAVNFFHKLLDDNSLVVVQKLQWLRPARDGKGLDIAMELMAPQA